MSKKIQKITESFFKEDAIKLHSITVPLPPNTMVKSFASNGMFVTLYLAPRKYKVEFIRTPKELKRKSP